MKRFSEKELTELRNEIPINIVIEDILKIPCKMTGSYFRFLCPLCREFLTATHPRTNLARCFRCKINFNPIEMVMVSLDSPFVESVKFLQAKRHVVRKLLRTKPLRRPRPPSELMSLGEIFRKIMKEI